MRAKGSVVRLNRKDEEEEGGGSYSGGAIAKAALGLTLPDNVGDWHPPGNTLQLSRCTLMGALAAQASSRV